jgi:hypothetical protein
MGFTASQVAQLLKPINPRRVLEDPKGHSHVSQQDVTAHLIRMLGFGGFDIDIDGPHLVFETERRRPSGEPTGRWDVCYRAMCRLTVKDPHGQHIAHYEDGSTATAQNQARGEAHDLAYKSAISLSKKRAAINLGDQFGLSLYNKGQREALVMGTLVRPDGEADDEQDIQHGVAQQVSLGNDEIDHETGADDGTPPQDATRHFIDLIKVARGRPEIARTVRQARENGADMAAVGAAAEQRQKVLDGGPPKNADGSLSRSQMSDEDLAAQGAMTRDQLREHNSLRRDGEPEPSRIERSSAPDGEDPWANPEVPGE